MKGFYQTSIALILLLLINACGEKKIRERPRVMRSVLDNQPRMISVLLDSQMYVAYDLAKCQLYKVWKGGIDIQGAPYTNVKNIQPTSWGVSYTSDETDPLRWVILREGKQIKGNISNTYYLFDEGEIEFGYRVIMGNDTLKISERPLYFQEGKNPGLLRKFHVGEIPNGYDIQLMNSKETLSLVSNETITWKRTFNFIPPPEKPVLEEEFDHRGKLWISKSDCATCHELDKQMVGPSYVQIANRYAGQDVKNLLADRIKKGAKGQWGQAMMTPHPDLPEGVLKTMVDYILSLAEEPEWEEEYQISESRPIREAEETQQPKPGFGAPLEGAHPAYDVIQLHHSEFRPRVGALAFLPDGRLLVSTWDQVGGVYLLDGVQGDSSTVTVRLIASGLHEPLGLEVVDGEIFVVQKHELTRLIDHDGDEIADEYRVVCNSWGVSDDFHEFAFGLVHKDDHFYVSLSMAMRLIANQEQKFDRGRVIRISHNGRYDWINYGMRTPNGIGIGPEGEIFATDNQGQWLPGNKLVHVQKGAYMGMQWGILEGMEVPEETPPSIWLPQDEIGNSPSEPILIQEGPFKGQMFHGEVSNGGIKRDFLEKVNGVYQGAVFRFTQGLSAGINRIRWGPDGHLYAGGVGMVGGWSWKGRQYGLERLEYNGKPTFEMLAVRAKPDGFEIEMTLPVKEKIAPEDIKIQQWRYKATSSYGGPKLDLVDLKASSIEFSDDMKKMRLKIPGLKAGHVIYFLLPDTMTSADGLSLWSGEAWYTLNEIPAPD